MGPYHINTENRSKELLPNCPNLGQFEYQNNKVHKWIINHWAGGGIGINDSTVIINKQIENRRALIMSKVNGVC